MGGNALKNTVTERKDRDNYTYISGYVCGALSRLFPRCHALPVQAYHTKETFGDCDIILKSDNLPPNWVEMVQEEFKPNEMVKNGDVLSFDYEKMQIDLITKQSHIYDFAHAYFAYNDLGNLMGRIAHKMGFKYGDDGLWKMLRDPSTQTKYADIRVSLSLAEVFAFMGYDYGRFQMGFDTLDEMFEFAASTPYFSRVIFQLDNRNHASRIRDAKRPNYRGFLEWMEDKPHLDKYVWSSYTGDVVTPERLEERAFWQKKAEDTFAGYKEQCEAAWGKHSEHVLAKQKWNGDIVRGVTGLSGKLLGAFMDRCRNQHEDFNAWVIQQTPEQIEVFIRQMQATPEQ